MWDQNLCWIRIYIGPEFMLDQVDFKRKEEKYA